MIKSLASLRFVFAFMVFLHHIGILQDAIGHAFFYSLSGFILSYVYQERFVQQRFTRRAFLKLRFSRLYPLYMLTLLVAIPLTIDAFTVEPTEEVLKLVSSIFMLQSFIPVADYYFSFNGLAWSISDLFFFYMLFPILIKWIPKASAKALLGSSILVMLVIFGLMQIVPEAWQHWFFYVNPFLRLADFVLGMVLFQILKNVVFKKYEPKFTFYEIVACLLLIGFYWAAPLFPKVLRYSIYYWIPMTVFIGVFAVQKGYISRLLTNRVMLFLGELSFGFYLWHQLIIRYAYRFVNHYHLGINIWLLISLCFLIILVVSWFSYRYFEMPLKRKLRQFWF
ncbi:acyltransferase family protein [Leeuwenhoekiella sp. W20_SRS_FM14]|uniref:acyltransferase family protein n=1 Tax=Leeuwenhoekiella sp. W20_SRS_FM14 TaxID=3240270 RepID=UPI003F9A57BA